MFKSYRPHWEEFIYLLLMFFNHSWQDPANTVDAQKPLKLTLKTALLLHSLLTSRPGFRSCTTLQFDSVCLYVFRVVKSGSCVVELCVGRAWGPEGKHQNLVTRQVILRRERPQQNLSFFLSHKSTQSETPWGVTLSSFINSHNWWITPLHSWVSPDWLS